MPLAPGDDPTHIRLTDDRRKRLLRSLGELYLEIFDEELSPYRAEKLLDFFLQTLGPLVYNQAIQDARAFMLDKLNDLDADFYEREQPL